MTDKDVDEFCEDLVKQYSGAAIAELHVHIMSDRTFSNICHHRFMRLDYAIFGFDEGIDAFGGDDAWRNCVLWKVDQRAQPTFDAEENALRAAATEVRQLF